MVRKICPICDQVMKHSHYCTNCRSWVRHPYIREVTYYLNERHPEKETACSYHNNTAAGARSATPATPAGSSETAKTRPAGNTGMAGTKPNTAGFPGSPAKAGRPPNGSGSTGNSAKASQMPGRPSNSPPPTAASAKSGGTGTIRRNPTGTAGWVLQDPAEAGQGQAGSPYGSGARDRRISPAGTGYEEPKKSSGVLPVASFLVILVLVIAGLKAGIGYAGKQIFSQINGSEAYSFDEEIHPWELEWDYEEKASEEEDWWGDEKEYFQGEDWWDLESQELTDEETIALGRACQGDGHFAIEGSRLEEVIRQLLEKQGYRESMVSRHSYNVEYPRKDGQTANSFFSSYTTFSLGKNGEIVYGNYVDLDCDTATGQLHEVDISMEDKAEAVEMTVEILKVIEKEYGVTEAEWSEALLQEMPKEMDSEEGYDRIWEDVWISGGWYEDSYWISIDIAE